MKSININETKFGFKLVKVEEVKDLNATLYHFVHEKSGGLVLHLDCDDTNCGAAFGFRTCPQDSTGVCHIIEHSVLCGSKKYPLKEPFVNLLKSSLNTFLNAFTAYDWTMYPFSSQVPKDFDNILKIYADAVFNPSVLYDRKPFLQEGWHLELNDVNDTPSYKGVVYNEMKGAMSDVEEVLVQTTLEAMYKDSFYRFNSGGDPDVIPTLTYEAYRDFYKKHYNPQNCMTFFYGKMDIESKLEFLDKEYFSNYDKSHDIITIEPQKPFVNLDYQKEYEIGEEEDVKDNTYISLCYGLDHYKNFEELMAMQILTEVLLSTNDSPVKKALLDAKLGQDISCRIDDDNIIPALHVYLHKSNPSNKTKFKELFESEIKKQVENGIDKGLLLAAINYNEFKAKEMDNGRTPKGIIYAMALMQSFNYGCDYLGVLEYSKYYKKFKDNLNTNYFENILKKYILDSKHNVLVMITPSKTLGKQKKEAMDKKMNTLKDSLSLAEKEELVKQTKDLIAYQNHVDTKKELATLPKLALKDIPSKINYLDSKEIKIGNLNGILHKLNTNKIGYLRLFFDAKAISYDDLPYLYLFKCLLLNCKTSKYSVEELQKQIKTYLGDFSVSTMPLPNKDGKGAKEYLKVSISALDENIHYIPDFVNQVLLHSKFNAKDTLRIVKQLATNMRQNIIGNGMASAMIQTQSAYSDTASIMSKTSSGIEAYEFFNNLSKNFDFNVVKDKFAEIVKSLFTVNNCFFTISGEKDSQALLKKAIRKIKLSKEETKEKLKVKRNKVTKGALVVPSGVSYNALSNIHGLEHSGKFAVISHIIRYDYLWSEVRVKGGAYGCNIAFSRLENTVTLGSFRDPNVANTYDIYNNLPNYLRSFKVSPNEMASYIIGAMGDFDMPGSNPSLINEWDVNYLIGFTKELKMKIKKEIISTTVEDINNMADVFEKLLKGSNQYTIGNEAKIKEYSFDNIKTLQ